MNCAATKTCRDFVDYDSNLIAVAHGVPDTAAKAAAVLDRVDRGRCSAASGGGPQFVSELYYGKKDTTQVCLLCLLTCLRTYEVPLLLLTDLEYLLIYVLTYLLTLRATRAIHGAQWVASLGSMPTLGS